MTDLSFVRLTALQRPLLAGFYREQRSAMRPRGDGQLWVARSAEKIVAGLSLLPLEQGNWLTGLFVTPIWRKNGVARRLIEHAAQQATGPVWLFCEPELASFYTALGFTPATLLPDALTARLTRYRVHKDLEAFVRPHSDSSHTLI